MGYSTDKRSPMTSHHPLAFRPLCFQLALGALLALPAIGAPASTGPAPDATAAADHDRMRAILLAADESCRKGAFDLRKWIAEVKSYPQSLQPSTEADAAMALYSGCLTALPGGKNSCEPLRSHNSYSLCTDWLGLTVMWAMFHSQDPLSVCMQGAPLETPSGPSDNSALRSRSKICEFLMSNLKNGSGKDICDKFKTVGWLPSPLGKSYPACLERMAFLGGRPALCPNHADASRDFDPFCKEEAAFLAALRSGDSRACWNSPFCAALASGKALACAPYRARAAKLLCADAAKLAAQFEPEKRTIAEENRKSRAVTDASIKAAGEKNSRETQEKQIRAAVERERQRLKAAAAKPPKPQLKEGEVMNRIPLEVKKRLEELSAPAQAPAQVPAPAPERGQ